MFMYIWKIVCFLYLGESGASFNGESCNSALKSNHQVSIMSSIAMYYYYVFPSHNTTLDRNKVKSIFLNTNTLSLITVKNK